MNSPEVRNEQLAYLVEDLGSRSWWSHGLSGDRIDSLWIKEDSPEGELGVHVLRQALAGFSWVGMGTMGGRSQSRLPRFADRYPGLVATSVAASRMEDPRELAYQSEWFRVDEKSEHLAAFFDMVRLSRGRGNCVAVSGDHSSAREFFAVTSGLTWRLATGSLDPECSQLIDDWSTGALLNLLPRVGFLPIVPLDKHPWSGFAIFGAPEQISGLVENLPPTLALSRSAREVEILHDHAGGVAL